MTHGRAEIHELLLANDLRPSRALGQNFVADGNTVRRIVRLAGITEGRPVVEIGAGLGSLTLALVEGGALVTAVEIDRHVLPVLRGQVEPLGVRVVEADALTLDWTELLGTDPTGQPTDGPWSLVANLPYNVAVPLVIRVLEEAPQVSSLLVMVQREVGERLAAKAGDEAYGAVSVKVAYWAAAAVVGRVSASVFIPRPNVESVLVRLDRREHADGADGADRGGPGDSGYDRLFAVVRGGFAHRRKMLRRSLEELVRPEAFEATGIPPTARAEELPLADWERLAAWRPDGPGRDPHPGSAAHPVNAADSAQAAPERRRGPGPSGSRGGSLTARPVELTAPAKLTVSLRVTGRRADGFHLLESEMVTIDLADTLVVGDGEGLSIEEAFDRSGPPGGWRTGGIATGPENLVARALRAVGRVASVRLIKRIPPGAGLGGGSADAAAVLRWSGSSDVALAAGLGSDVPFCLVGGRALVRGVGEDLRPLPYEDRRFTLFLLPFGMDTGAVYAAWDRLHPPGEVPGAPGAVGAGPDRRPAGGLNDLEEAAVSVEPRLAAWKDHLARLTGQRPWLAGSGSTWFVEGTPDQVGLDARSVLHLGTEQAFVVSVRTVPAAF